MSLDVFQAVVKGYSDRLLDMQILGVQSGYWAAYYVGSKHPKLPKDVAASMLRAHKKSESQQKTVAVSTPAPAADVDTFLAREARFKAKLGR